MLYKMENIIHILVHTFYIYYFPKLLSYSNFTRYFTLKLDESPCDTQVEINKYKYQNKCYILS